jgi:mono/diheme cytochrome c family protein
VTEVPDYLLRRSQERREALGLLPKGSFGDAPAEAAPEAAPAEASAATAVAEAPAPAAAAAAPAPAPAPTEDLPTYVAPPGPRTGIPVWMYPVLAVLPLWAIVYLGSFGTTGDANAAPTGPGVYQSAGCGGCHGPRGEGGVGPKLSGGETKLTFPNEADHVAWIETGSASKKGQQYGDPARPGGAKTAASGGMPGFKGQLSDAEIKAVVVYEREGM